MTRIGSIFALVLVALLASFALVDAGLPPALAGGGGIVEATPLEAPVVLPSESSKAPRSREREPAAVDRPSVATPLDDEEKAPTHASAPSGPVARDESTDAARAEGDVGTDRRWAPRRRRRCGSQDRRDASCVHASERPRRPGGRGRGLRCGRRETANAGDDRRGDERDAADVTHETRSSSSSSNFSSTDPSSARSPSTDAAEDDETPRPPSRRPSRRRRANPSRRSRARRVRTGPPRPPTARRGRRHGWRRGRHSWPR